jgi:alpha-tubulin suppressor-like RCC1 family protein
VQVSGLTSGVIAVSAGGDSACAVTIGGGVECWGYNGYGQLGNNSTTNSSVPVQVSGLTSGVTAVSAGNVSACALTTGGSVECWGDNRYGELGNNSTTSSSVPVEVSGF